MYNGGKTRKTITRRMRIAAFSGSLYTDKEKDCHISRVVLVCHFFCICSRTLDGFWMKPECTGTAKG